MIKKYTKSQVHLRKEEWKIEELIHLDRRNKEVHTRRYRVLLKGWEEPVISGVTFRRLKELGNLISELK